MKRRIYLREMAGGETHSLPASFGCHDVTYSPRGTHLAYTVREAGAWSLRVFDLSRGEEETVLDSDQRIASPQWSPDQKKILFSWTLSHNRDIWAIDLADATRHPLRVTRHPATDEGPVWDERNDRVVFTSDRGRGLEFSTIYWIPIPDALR